MTTPVERILSALRGHGYEPKRAGKSVACRCPAHNDRNPSLSIDAGDDGRALVKCHAGCTVEAVCGAIGLRPADLFAHDPSRRNGRVPRPRRGVTVPTTPRKPARGTGTGDGDAPTFPTAREAVAALERRHGPHSAVWTYHDATGEPVGLVVRWERPPKKPGGEPGKEIQPVSKLAGGWANKGMPTPRPLYGLPELLATKPGARVYVTEGEKAADAARAVGLAATTSPHGSKSASKADWSPLAGRDVVILPDDDDAGADYADDVARLATAAGARSVRIVWLVELWAELPEGGDMADLVEHRGGGGGDIDSIRAEIVGLAAKAEPVDTQKAPVPRTLRQLLAEYPDVPAAIIGGVIGEGDVATFVAESKARKTMLVMDLALAVATGREWLGTFKTMAGDVLLVDNELRPEWTADRLRKILSARGIDPEAVAERVQVCNLRGWNMDIRALGDYFASVLRPGRFKVIIIDALYKTIPEGFDENSNANMTAVMNYVFEYARKYGAAVIVVHHSPKGAQGTKNVVDVGAGAGALGRAPDCICVFRAHEEDDVVVFEARPRNYPIPRSLCLRWTWPTWNPVPEEEGLDPKALRGSSGRRARPAGEAKPKPEPWTLARFVPRFVGAVPKSMDAIVVEAREAGVGVAESKRLVSAGVEARKVHKWQYKGSNQIKYACAPQPVTATVESGPAKGAVGVSLSRARPPIPPRIRKSGPGTGSKRARERSFPGGNTQ